MTDQAQKRLSQTPERELSAHSEQAWHSWGKVEPSPHRNQYIVINGRLEPRTLIIQGKLKSA